MKIENAKGIAILGRQPKIGLAELESLYGSECVVPFGEHAALLNIDACQIDFDRLGGSIRYGTILLKLPSTRWKDIENFLVKNAPLKATEIDGKLKFGISAYGFKMSPKNVAKTALLVKKAIKHSGKSVRMVPHSDLQLNSAVVLNNKLSGNPLAWELLVIKNGDKAILAQTTNIQDIDKYAQRDQARPKRDAKVGMLPPKLAQVLVNLAVGNITREVRSEEYEVKAEGRITCKQEATPHPSPRTPHLILDPFCGTGVLLQEAMLMDYDIYGTDIEPRMIEYTIDNMKWLDRIYPDKGDYRRIEIGDATIHKWDFSATNNEVAVATEVFLGKPLSKLPESELLSRVMNEVNAITHKFLTNIVDQIESGTRLCLAIPTWRGKHEFLHLPLLDHLTEMRYTRLRFQHASNEDLIYHRDNQVVGRELLVLEKK